MDSTLARALAGALAAFAIVAALRLTGSLERLELAAYDAGLRARPHAALDERIVIIDETEEDLLRWGHPFSDELLARIIERAAALGPRVIGVDKFRDIPVPPGSPQLERVLAAHPNVLWIYQFGGLGARRIAPPAALAGSPRAGFNDLVQDASGIVRRGLLYLDDGGQPQPSFPLILALAYLERDGIAPQADPANPANLKLGRAVIEPLEGNDGGYAGADAAGYQVLVDYHGAPARFPRVTVTQLLEGTASPALFRDRIAILGASAESLKDFFHTPYSTDEAGRLMGAELHAHVASQLVRLARGESERVTTLPEALEYLLIALACTVGLGAWLAPRGAWLAGLFAAAALALAIVWYALAADDVWFPVVPVALGLAVSGSLSAGLRAMHEARERATVMTLFARHVSPEVAAELWQRRAELLDGYRLRPRTLFATVLFADVRGYSPVAEQLDPVQTANWLNQFLTMVADAVMLHDGVIRQYAGDAVMAVFGAPVPSETRRARERDAANAVRCAVRICETLDALNERWTRAGMPRAGVRIGIHSGPMVACSVGSDRRMEYAVVGDSVNIAARLQALSLVGDDDGAGARRILIGEATRELLHADAECQRVGTFEVKGRREPVTVYRIGARELTSRAEAA